MGDDNNNWGRLLAIIGAILTIVGYVNLIKNSNLPIWKPVIGIILSGLVVVSIFATYSEKGHIALNVIVLLFLLVLQIAVIGWIWDGWVSIGIIIEVIALIIMIV